MVDLMCSFGFVVLFCPSFVSPHEFVFDWVIGWDYSMFLCPSAPPWFRHQSLLYPVVGALSCWEYASWRFEIVNLPHVLKPIGELDLGICFNLSTFDILKWKATEISFFSLSLDSCVIFQHLYVLP